MKGDREEGIGNGIPAAVTGHPPSVTRRPLARPRIICSRCLEFEACRFDGAVMPDGLVRKLLPFVDFVTICPEVEIGLGVPRKPVRLVRHPAGDRMVQPSSGRDLTREIDAFAEAFLAGVGSVDGAILKYRSPSCGTSDVRVYDGPGKAAGAVGKASGRFASAVIARFKDLPVESEGRLRDFSIREHFLTSVFASAACRGVVEECEAKGSRAPLVEYHASMKLQLMTMNREEERRLGRLVASTLPLVDILGEYSRGLSRSLGRVSRPGATVDALLHALGFFSKDLNAAEKALFLDNVEGYRSGRLPLSACLAVLGAWLVRNPKPWLSAQVFFSPYPLQLIDMADSGKERDLE
jgi:uncharacterized protein YbbK (DUF523 family)/uncharacterized protein YbgA (DUF1722 family)